MIAIPVDLGDRSYDVVVGDGARRAAAPTPSRCRPERPPGGGGDPGGIGVEVDPGLPPRSSPSPTARRPSPCDRRGAVPRLRPVGPDPGRRRRGRGRWGGDRPGRLRRRRFHRGTAYVNVATSLLAQVDAAIGGKTGVNLPEGKNLVGAFWQPSAVLCDTDDAVHPPRREWASGPGRDGQVRLPRRRPEARRPDASADRPAPRRAGGRGARRSRPTWWSPTSGRAIAACCSTTATPWPMPSRRRRSDRTGRLDLRHGEAVAVGLVFAALLARRLGRIDDDRVALHRAVVGGFDLPPTCPPGVDPDELRVVHGPRQEGAATI